MRLRRLIRTCRTGKRVYARETAITKAAELQALPRGQMGHRMLGAYPCEACHGWHVGHRPRVLPRPDHDDQSERTER